MFGCLYITRREHLLIIFSLILHAIMVSNTTHTETYSTDGKNNTVSLFPFVSFLNLVLSFKWRTWCTYLAELGVMHSDTSIMFRPSMVNSAHVSSK